MEFYLFLQTLFHDVQLDLCDTSSGNSKRLRSGRRDVDDASRDERTAVIDPNGHRLPGGDVGDAHLGTERQCAVSGGQLLRIEVFAARGPRLMPVKTGKTIRAAGRLGCLFVGLRPSLERVSSWRRSFACCCRMMKVCRRPQAPGHRPRPLPWSAQQPASAERRRCQGGTPSTDQDRLDRRRRRGAKLQQQLMRQGRTPHRVRPGLRVEPWPEDGETRRNRDNQLRCG